MISQTYFSVVYLDFRVKDDLNFIIFTNTLKNYTESLDLLADRPTPINTPIRNLKLFLTEQKNKNSK